jgi:teichuronic acid exporter
MINKVTNKQILSSLFWKLMERGGVQGISFVISIILARLLTPKEFGLIALVTIFITLSNVFVQTGFNTALIQKKNADDIDFSTIFYISLFIASCLYILLCFSSPIIADFFNQPQLVLLIKILSLVLFFGAINSVQVAVISRNMQFKKLFYSSIGAVIASGVIGIMMAYAGFGVWALVGQQITSQLFTTIIMWFTVHWRPKLLFSYKRLKSLWSYGWKILVASLIDVIYLDLRSLVIGKLFSPTMLGYYDRGKQFPTVIVNNIDGSIQSVMLPTYASHQENRERVRSIVKRSITTSSFVIFPLMMGLAIVAEPLVIIILTDKWLPCVPFLQIYCAVYAIRPILTANIQAIKGLGYSGDFLKVEFINKVIGIIVLVISVQYGVLAIAWGVLLSSIISMFLYTYPNIKISVTCSNLEKV